jgi:hypothetical protein
MRSILCNKVVESLKTRLIKYSGEVCLRVIVKGLIQGEFLMGRFNDIIEF